MTAHAHTLREQREACVVMTEATQSDPSLELCRARIIAAADAVLGSDLPQIRALSQLSPAQLNDILARVNVSWVPQTYIEQVLDDEFHTHNRVIFSREAFEDAEAEKGEPYKKKKRSGARAATERARDR